MKIWQICCHYFSKYLYVHCLITSLLPVVFFLLDEINDHFIYFFGSFSTTFEKAYFRHLGIVRSCSLKIKSFVKVGWYPSLFGGKVKIR